MGGSATLVGDDVPRDDARYVTFSNLFGVTAPGVTLTLPDGTQVDATVGSERFLAWWPGEEVPGIDLGEAMGPEWDPAEGITLTWTYEDGTTGGPADL